MIICTTTICTTTRARLRDPTRLRAHRFFSQFTNFLFEHAELLFLLSFLGLSPTGASQTTMGDVMVILRISGDREDGPRLLS